MDKIVRTFDYKKLLRILEDTEDRYVYEKVNLIPKEEDLLEKLTSYVNYNTMTRKSVLGIDIYKYSSYEQFEQTLVPFLFKILFVETIEMCFRNHAFFFQKYTKTEIEEHYISTGDGGFMIFDTPLHSLIFACNFAIVLRTYNSFHFYPKLRKIIGGASLRYAITYDTLYYFDTSHYGRAIINNARILSKDNLNRCIIDQNVYDWFTLNIDGLENLQVLTIDEMANIYDLQGSYDYEILKESPDAIFGKKASRDYGILNSDVLKIGEIRSKESTLSVYNIHLQVAIKVERTSVKRMITISLGNLNTSHLL
ncbi:MAG: hypothetical protein PF481_08800 [Bacteroidales bacterium]|jgi:hypothetical protein|nr:hypothetical protein [Bacteroidales bacterium]